jgi:hypothetical protein
LLARTFIEMPCEAAQGIADLTAQVTGRSSEAGARLLIGWTKEVRLPPRRREQARPRR